MNLVEIDSRGCSGFEQCGKNRNQDLHLTRAGMAKGLGAQFLALLAALFVVLVPSFASAQDVPTVISPLRVESDPNGVNLVTGLADLSGPTLGVPGAPHLVFEHIKSAAPYIEDQRAIGTPFVG